MSEIERDRDSCRMRERERERERERWRGRECDRQRYRGLFVYVNVLQESKAITQSVTNIAVLSLHLSQADKNSSLPCQSMGIGNQRVGKPVSEGFHTHSAELWC